MTNTSLGSRINTERRATAGKPRAVPDGGGRNRVHGTTHLFAVPVGQHDRCPLGGVIFGDTREVGQAPALQPGPPHLSGAARWGRLMEGGVQSKAGYEGDDGLLSLRQRSRSFKEA